MSRAVSHTTGSHYPFAEDEEDYLFGVEDAACKA
jgi:hypothetical protein